MWSSVVLGCRLVSYIIGMHGVGRSPLTQSKGVFRFQSYYRLHKACANTNAKSLAKVTEQVDGNAQEKTLFTPRQRS